MSLDWCVVLGVLCAVGARRIHRDAHPAVIAFVAVVGSLGAIIGSYLGLALGQGRTGSWSILPWGAAGAVILPFLFHLSALRDDAEEAALALIERAPKKNGRGSSAPPPAGT